ncbi:MAG: hypothetical protein LW700_09160 [Gemmataceae bacterium]|nr:hypothetical protein [Gemmataceae bacterium]
MGIKKDKGLQGNSAENQVVGMANSYFGTSVGLPRDHDQVFPDCCVSCLAHEAEKRVRIRASTDSWLPSLLGWFRGPLVEAKLCKSCSNQLFAVGLLKIFALFVPLLSYVWLGLPLLNQHVPSHLAFWARFGGLLLVCLPFAIAEMLLPKPYDLQIGKDLAEHRFASRHMALRFLVENQNAESLSLNDEPIFQNRLEAENNPKMVLLLKELGFHELHQNLVSLASMMVQNVLGQDLEGDPGFT